MRTVVKKVYYCDHCNKRYLSKYHIVKHEEHCTMNPDRDCGLCGAGPGAIQESIEKFKKRFKIVEREIDSYDGQYTFTQIDFKWTGIPVTENEILDEVDGCPICALAIVRQSGLTQGYVSDFVYNYQGALDAWWKQKHEDDWQRERFEMSGLY